MCRQTLVAVALLVASAGCTHRQLSRSTVHTTGTVMDIQYRTVLMNVAMLSCHPDTLPSYVRMKDGVVQVNDEAGLGTSGGFTTLGSNFGLETWGPSGSRQVSEQWGTDAVTDPRDVKTLQDLHRVALGLAPLPDPEAIRMLNADANGESNDQSEQSSSNGDSERANGDEESGGSGNGSSNGDGNGDQAAIPLAVLIWDVPPPGWFQLGSKRDVPANACYVGNYGDRYAWVTPEGMPGLARFTLTILSVLKYKPGDVRTSSGLAFTR